MPRRARLAKAGIAENRAQIYFLIIGADRVLLKSNDAKEERIVCPGL